MTELEELRIAYAESSRQKNELLTAHKISAAENAALRELNDKLHAQLAEDTARWSGKAFAAEEQVRELREACANWILGGME